MSNRFAKSHSTDLNQPAIIDALVRIGCQCHEIERPVDLLVEFRGMWILLEVKNKKGKNKLTKEQDRFFGKVKAPAFIVRDIEEACAAVQTAWKRQLNFVE